MPPLTLVEHSFPFVNYRASSDAVAWLTISSDEPNYKILTVIRSTDGVCLEHKIDYCYIIHSNTICYRRSIRFGSYVVKIFVAEIYFI